MENLFTIFIVALIAESVWETLKMIWQQGKVSIDRIGALIVSLVICIGVRLDILSLLGLKSGIPFLGIVLTSILILPNTCVASECNNIFDSFAIFPKVTISFKDPISLLPYINDAKTVFSFIAFLKFSALT